MALATIFNTTPQDSHHKRSLLFDIAHRTSIGHCSDFDLRKDIIYIIGHVVLCVVNILDGIVAKRTPGVWVNIKMSSYQYR